MDTTNFKLVGDIGATYARFCLVRPDGTLMGMKALPTRDYATLGDALGAYIRNAGAAMPDGAVLAVATAPLSDYVALTNNPWSFSIEQLRQSLGLRMLRIVNDFHAQAAAIPYLSASDRVQIGAGVAVADAPVGLIGPGTGLGVGALVFSATGPMPIPGEGGHVTMAPVTPRESAVLERLRLLHDHVSAERAISGPGLVNLYDALCDLDGAQSPLLQPAQITDPHTRAKDARAQEAADMFCAMLGTVAGNLALTLGARGGIYITGGIVPKLGDFFAQSQFRERFEAKGRLRGYLAAIPTFVVVHPWVGLLGASKLLEQPRLQAL